MRSREAGVSRSAPHLCVMAGLDPAIHVFPLSRWQEKEILPKAGAVERAEIYTKTVARQVHALGRGSISN